MLTPQQRAEIARRNGALSKGPTTAQGKLRSCRNALRHGRRASTLAEFLPPQSAVLSKEERQLFFALLDQNLAKYYPNDYAEKAVVREITEAQWANHRIARARQSRLNAELALLGGDLSLACESAFTTKSMAALRLEFNSNARLVAQAERRLKQMQQVWPATHPAEMTSTPDRAAESERTQSEPAQTIENTTELQNPHILYIRYSGPLTPEIIAKHQKLFPNRDLSFIDVADKPAM